MHTASVVVVVVVLPGNDIFVVAAFVSFLLMVVLICQKQLGPLRTIEKDDNEGRLLPALAFAALDILVFVAAVVANLLLILQIRRLSVILCMIHMFVIWQNPDSHIQQPSCVLWVWQVLRERRVEK